MLDVCRGPPLPVPPCSHQSNRLNLFCTKHDVITAFEKQANY